MKNKMITALILATASGLVSAKELSSSSLVDRSLVLKQGEFQFVAGVAYGDDKKRSDTGLILAGGYGITDNFSVGPAGLSYLVLPKAGSTGLEVAVTAGLSDYLKQDGKDVWGYGADITGKYVFNKQLAFTAGAEYVFWNTRGSENAKEFRYSAGALYSPIHRVTFNLGYAYRDLKDFVQNDAYVISTGINYALTPQMDLGLEFAYSDFDAQLNGFDSKYSYKRNYGAYVNYRF